MKVVKQPLSQFEFEKLIKSIKFSGSKEKIISLGGNLTIRAYQTGTIVFFYRGSGSNKLTRIGIYQKEFSYSQALMYCKQITLSPIFPFFNNQLPVKETKQLLAPKFSEVAIEWLETKRHLARYANYRKCVEYLSFLNNYKVNEIKNTFVKNNLLSMNIKPYKLKETLSVLCRIMDLAVQNEYIEYHNLRLLLNSEYFSRTLPLSEGYKFVELNDLDKYLISIALLDKHFVLYFLLLIMTCLRPGECRQLRYKDFDLNKKILNVPGNIMKVKTSKPFRIPLTTFLINLYIHIKQSLFTNNSCDSDYIFQAKTSSKPLSERDISIALKFATKGAIQPHGFRKTARTFFAESDINIEVAALCLAHKLNTGADSVYQKSDLLSQRRFALEKYHQEIYKIAPDSIKLFMDN